jgi:hypothetical protein
MKNRNDYSINPSVELYESCFKDRKTPRVFVDIILPTPCLVFTEPELVNEIYTTYDKVLDKTDMFYYYTKELMGRSTVFSKADELWAVKRKRLSHAFYKDRMV